MVDVRLICVVPGCCIKSYSSRISSAVLCDDRTITFQHNGILFADRHSIVPKVLFTICPKASYTSGIYCDLRQLNRIFVCEKQGKRNMCITVTCIRYYNRLMSWYTVYAFRRTFRIWKYPDFTSIIHKVHLIVSRISSGRFYPRPYFEHGTNSKGLQCRRQFHCLRFLLMFPR